MSKLTEIKVCMEILDNPGEYTMTTYDNEDDKLRERGKEWLQYLLSLLEEKDKALAFYADKKNYDTVYENEDDPFSLMSEKILIDSGDIARKALNTSSNNEGDSNHE